ncbi:hypothetical protein RI054_45g153980 [Pseudoscourfieldia marina]
MVKVNPVIGAPAKRSRRPVGVFLLFPASTVPSDDRTTILPSDAANSMVSPRAEKSVRRVVLRVQPVIVYDARRSGTDTRATWLFFQEILCASSSLQRWTQTP